MNKTEKSEREKETRRYLKSVNRCIRCQGKDAYTMIGRSYCFECVTKMEERNKEYKKANKEKTKEKQKELRKYRKANNLCTYCGGKLPSNNIYFSCPTCRAKKRKEKRIRDRKNGVYSRQRNQICWTCNKNPVLEGKGLCKECYERQLKILENGPNKKVKEAS